MVLLLLDEVTESGCLCRLHNAEKLVFWNVVVIYLSETMTIRVTISI